MTVNTYVGNDKSGVFLEVFNIMNLDVCMRYLEGFFRYSKKLDISLVKSSMTKDGFYLDYDYMSVEISNSVKKSFSNPLKRSILIKLRINPIRLVANSHFNYLQNNFSWDVTKQLFIRCFQDFKNKLNSFVNLSEDELRKFLIPEKMRVSTIINLFMNNPSYGQSNNEEWLYSINDFAKFLRSFAKVSESKVFKLEFIDRIELTDVFELSITADIHLSNVNERIAFLQRISEFSIPSTTKSEYVNETILFDPYDKRTSKSLLKKHPRIRAYLKLNNVNALYAKRMEQLVKDHKSIQHHLFNNPQGLEYKEDLDKRYKDIKQTILSDMDKAVRMLQNVVRLEIDYRTNKAINNHFGTSKFEELGFDNRKEITKCFQTHFQAQQSTISIQEAIDIILEKTSRRKGSIARLTLLNLVGLPFSQIQSIIYSLNVTQEASTTDKTAQIRNQFARLKPPRNVLKNKKHQGIVIGEGQNLTVKTPFKQALAYINATSTIPIKQVFEQINNATYERLNVTQLAIYNIININNNYNYKLLREDYNIISPSVSFTSVDSLQLSSAKEPIGGEAVLGSRLDKLLEAIRSGVDNLDDLEKMGYSPSLLAKLCEQGHIFQFRPCEFKVLE